METGRGSKRLNTPPLQIRFSKCRSCRSTENKTMCVYRVLSTNSSVKDKKGRGRSLMYFCACLLILNDSSTLFVSCTPFQRAADNSGPVAHDRTNSTKRTEQITYPQQTPFSLRNAGGLLTAGSTISWRSHNGKFSFRKQTSFMGRITDSPSTADATFPQSQYESVSNRKQAIIKRIMTSLVTPEFRAVKNAPTSSPASFVSFPRSQNESFSTRKQTSITSLTGLATAAFPFQKTAPEPRSSDPTLINRVESTSSVPGVVLSPNKTTVAKRFGDDFVTVPNYFVLDTAQVKDCLVNSRELDLSTRNGVINFHRLLTSEHLTTQYLQCRVKLRISPGEAMLLRVSDLSCNNAPYYFNVEQHSSAGIQLNFKSFDQCKYYSEGDVFHGYTLADVTDVIFVLGTYISRDTYYRPISGILRFTRRSQSDPFLRVEMKSPFFGVLSTPKPEDGGRALFYELNTWIVITIPADHIVMVSVVYTDIEMIAETCMRSAYVGLYNFKDFNFKNYLALYCGWKTNVAPASFSVPSGRLFVRFVHRTVSGGFEFFFSLRPRSKMLVQRADGMWNCSVPQWPDFAVHFPCNVYANCLGGEDEAPCPYTTELCGEGRLTVSGKCYAFIKTDRPEASFNNRVDPNLSWTGAEKKCRDKGGHLASFQSLREMMDIYDRLHSSGDYNYVFIGMKRADTTFPALYKDMWETLDDSINHFMGCFKHSKMGCQVHLYNAAMIGEDYTLFFINRDCPTTYTDTLCEVPPRNWDSRAKSGIPGHHSGMPPKIPSIDSELSDYLWNSEAYVTCPDGHVVHAFLACDVHSACWARGFSISGSCSAALRPLPPGMMCNNGVQFVPYSLVCDHRSDCDDNTDENFCVFAPLDVLTHFQCSNGQRVPNENKCDGKIQCSDATDENMCPYTLNDCPTRKELPPAILLFDGRGHSTVRSLNRRLAIHRRWANGTLINATIANAELAGHTFKGLRVNETMVSGILLKGIVVSGVWVNRTPGSGVEIVARGSQVLGTLISALLVQGTPQQTSLVNGMLLNSTVVTGTTLCPETHFQCANDSYCVPVFTRCNHVYDCPGREDEEGCDSYWCPGYYRCRGANICLHKRDVCDGVLQCPQNDDELLCDLSCPSGCTCYGHAFFCSRVTPFHLYPNLRFLDASDSGIRVRELENNTMLVYLSLVRCRVAVWDIVTLPNLCSLDLSENNFTSITVQFFQHLPNLKQLALAQNPLTAVFMEELVLSESVLFLRSLDLSGVYFSELDMNALSVFPRLNILNLTGCHLDRVIGEGFQILQQLRVLDLRGCPMTYFPRDVFRGLSELSSVYADNYRLCCRAVLPEGFYNPDCKAPSDEVSSCEDLLRSHFFRMCLCLFAVLACVGNLSSIFFRMKGGKDKLRNGFDMFVLNLCVSDSFMGVYLSIIGLADRLYMGKYLWYDISWRQSGFCKVAGFLSLLSSELSAFIICLITLDRFLVFRFPFSRLRFSTTTAFLASAVAWAICLVISAVPLLPSSSHWNFYGQSGICIPLPITRTDFKGKGYSFGVVIVLNFVLFLFIAIGQLFVYLSVQKNKMPIIGDTDSALSRDQALARRLITVAASDFLCWFPIGVAGMIAADGYHIPSEVNSVMAIFVLPLNSAINPFLYTLNIVLEKNRRSREQRLKQTLLSYMNVQGVSSASSNVARSSCNHTREEAHRLFKQWLNKGVMSREYALPLLLDSDVVISSVSKTAKPV